MSEAGDVVNSSSYVGLSPAFDPLYVDLCQLALGSIDFGIPDYFNPAMAPEYPGVTTNPGCSNAVARAMIAYEEGGIYVCPGPTHRDRALNYQCGFANVFYCASWGCEMAGDTAWKPYSSWDYISLKRAPRQSNEKIYENCQKSSPLKGWCNPLIITFTEKGKQFLWAAS